MKMIPSRAFPGKPILTRIHLVQQLRVNTVFLEVPHHWLDIAESKLFQQFHLDHRPSGTQQYHTSCRKSRNIFVNSTLGFADPYVVIQTIYYCQEKNTHPPLTNYHNCAKMSVES